MSWAACRLATPWGQTVTIRAAPSSSAIRVVSSGKGNALAVGNVPAVERAAIADVDDPEVGVVCVDGLGLPRRRAAPPARRGRSAVHHQGSGQRLAVMTARSSVSFRAPWTVPRSFNTTAGARARPSLSPRMRVGSPSDVGKRWWRRRARAARRLRPARARTP